RCRRGNTRATPVRISRPLALPINRSPNANVRILRHVRRPANPTLQRRKLVSGQPRQWPVADLTGRSAGDAEVAARRPGGYFLVGNNRLPNDLKPWPMYS